MAKAQAQNLTRALVWGAADQERMMALTGLKKDHVYRGDKPSKWTMRPGELLGVFDLRACGPDRDAMVRGLREAVKHGGVVVEVADDGTLGDRSGDHTGAVLLANTQRKMKAEQVMPTEKAKAMAAKRHADKIAARMPVERALKIWQNLKRYPYAEDALLRMPGWNKGLAYRILKQRETKPGRKPANK